MSDNILFTLNIFLSGYLFSAAAYIFEALTGKLFNDIRSRILSFLLFLLWTSTLLFFILTVFGVFSKIAVFIIVTLIALVTVVISRLSITEISRRLKKYYSDTVLLLYDSSYMKYKYLLIIFLFCFFAIIFRTVIVPPLGWDTITYHGPKAVTWAKTGSLINFLNAPGGPTYANNMFGGGEIFYAWGLLMFNNDFVYGITDALFYIMLAVSFFSMATLFNHKEKALILTITLLSVNAVWLSVGSGYVELVLWICFILGVFFFMFFLKQKDIFYSIFSVISFGLAAGIKISLFPVFALVFLICLITVLVRSDKPLLNAAFLSAAGFFSFLLLVPWLVITYQNSGFYFSFPVEILGFKLGNWDPALQWYRDRTIQSDLTELSTFLVMFYGPRRIITNLGVLSLILMISGFLYLIIMSVRRKYEMLFYLLIVILIFWFFYSEEFKVVRLLCAQVSGRFLVPATIILFLFSLKETSRLKKYEDFFLFLVLITVFVQFVNGLFYGWHKLEIFIFGFYLMLLVIFYLLTYFLKKTYNTGFAIRYLVYFGLFIIGINMLFETRYIFRNNLIKHSTVLHQVPRFWTRAAEITDDPEKNYRIAVNTGPAQNQDNWFIYFFYGRRLQNELFYVSPVKDNSIFNFRDNKELEERSEFNSWYQRLRKEKIDLVLCLLPESLEFTWCNNNPQLFTLLEPFSINSSWGLFSVNHAEVKSE